MKDLSKVKLEIHIRTRVQKTRVASVKMPHRSRVFKTRVSCKKIFTYSGVFKPYSNVLKPYSDVFLQKILSTRFREPYSDVFKPYSGVFLQFMELESLKLNFDVDFFLTLNQSSYKSRLKNSSFILELEF